MKGNDSNRSTFGGKDFQWRTKTWKEDLLNLWSLGTVDSEWSPLRNVTLVYPKDLYLTLDTKDPDQYLFLDIPNLKKLREQCRQLERQFSEFGVDVHILEPSKEYPPNFIFQRDLYCATPLGVILGRPAAAQRRGEEVIQQSELAARNIPIISMPFGESYFEGADLLWVDEANAILSINNRSNIHFFKQIQNMMGPEVRFHIIELPKGVQHTLGIINFLNRGRIAIWKSQMSEKNLKVLQGISSIEEIVFLEDDDEIRTKRSMNWVLIKANTVVMPSQAPKTSKKLKSLGMDVHCVDISEYIKCGGGMGCATGILYRSEQN